MTIEPLLTASLAIKIHVLAALLAVAFTLVQLLLRGGGRWHRLRGYVWVGAMAVTCVSSFWILDIRLLGPFSPIHLLSAYVLYALYAGVTAARRRNITAHRRYMVSSAFWGLGVAGLATLLPGRRMGAVLFPDTPYLGMAAAAVVIAGVILALRARQSGLGYAASWRAR